MSNKKNQQQKNALSKEFDNLVNNTRYREVFRNNRNNKELHAPGEKNTMPSMTLPDQGMTLRQMVNRYAQGIMPTNMRTPLYSGDEVPQFLDQMDLTDRQRLLEETKDRVNELQAELREQYNDSQKKKQAKALTEPVNNKTQEKPNQGTQALGTIPTEDKSEPNA